MTASARPKRIELVAMACVVRRGKRTFDVMAQREPKNGFRRITVIESGHTDVYYVPVAECPTFYSGMLRRLLDRHVRGELRNKPKRHES